MMSWAAVASRPASGSQSRPLPRGGADVGMSASAPSSAVPLRSPPRAVGAKPGAAASPRPRFPAQPRKGATKLGSPPPHKLGLASPRRFGASDAFAHATRLAVPQNGVFAHAQVASAAAAAGPTLGGEPYLYTLVNAWAREVAADGRCFYNAMACLLQENGKVLPECDGASLRYHLTNYIRSNGSLPMDDMTLEQWVQLSAKMSTSEYADRMAASTDWAGGIELAVLSRAQNVNIHVFRVNRDGSGYRVITRFDVPGAKQVCRVAWVQFGNRMSDQYPNHYELMYGGRVRGSDEDKRAVAADNAVAAARTAFVLKQKNLAAAQATARRDAALEAERESAAEAAAEDARQVAEVNAKNLDAQARIDDARRAQDMQDAIDSAVEAALAKQGREHAPAVGSAVDIVLAAWEDSERQKAAEADQRALQADAVAAATAQTKYKLKQQVASAQAAYELQQQKMAEAAAAQRLESDTARRKRADDFVVAARHLKVATDEAAARERVKAQGEAALRTMAAEARRRELVSFQVTMAHLQADNAKLQELHTQMVDDNAGAAPPALVELVRVTHENGALHPSTTTFIEHLCTRSGQPNGHVCELIKTMSTFLANALGKQRYHTVKTLFKLPAWATIKRMRHTSSVAKGGIVPGLMLGRFDVYAEEQVSLSPSIVVYVSDATRVQAAIRITQLPDGRTVFVGNSMDPSCLVRPLWENLPNAPDTYAEVVDQLKSALNSDAGVAVNVMVGALFTRSGDPVRDGVRVIEAFPEPRRGGSMIHEVTSWHKALWHAYHHSDGTARAHPINLMVFASDHASSQLAAMLYCATANEHAAKRGVVYLHCGGLHGHQVSACHGPKPMLTTGDWLHGQRLVKKLLWNPRVAWTIGGSAAEGWLIASSGDIELALEAMGQGALASSMRTASYMDMSSDVAGTLTSAGFCDAFESVLPKLPPSARATLLALRAVTLVLEPMRERNFGTPFEVVRAMWSGLHLLRLFTAFVDEHPELRQKDNNMGSALRSVMETLVSQQTHYLLAAFMEKDIPWREKHACRDNASVPLEGMFGVIREGQEVMQGGVNLTYAGFLNALQRISATADAKSRIAVFTGVAATSPKQKTKSAAVQQTAEETLPPAFYAEVDSMGYDGFKAKIDECIDAGREDAIQLARKLVPSLLDSLEDAPPVVEGHSRVQLPKAPPAAHSAPWFDAAVHSGNGPFRPPGTLPPHPADPGLFDPRLAAQLAEQISNFDEELRELGEEMEGEDSHAPSLAARPPKPIVESPLLTGVVLGADDAATLLYCASFPNGQRVVAVATAGGEELPQMPEGVELSEAAAPPGWVQRIEGIATQGGAVHVYGVYMSACLTVAVLDMRTGDQASDAAAGFVVAAVADVPNRPDVVRLDDVPSALLPPAQAECLLGRVVDSQELVVFAHRWMDGSVSVAQAGSDTLIVKRLEAEAVTFEAHKRECAVKQLYARDGTTAAALVIHVGDAEVRVWVPSSVVLATPKPAVKQHTRVPHGDGHLGLDQIAGQVEHGIGKDRVDGDHRRRFIGLTRERQARLLAAAPLRSGSAIAVRTSQGHFGVIFVHRLQTVTVRSVAKVLKYSQLNVQGLQWVYSQVVQLSNGRYKMPSGSSLAEAVPSDLLGKDWLAHVVLEPTGEPGGIFKMATASLDRVHTVMATPGSGLSLLPSAQKEVAPKKKRARGGGGGGGGGGDAWDDGYDSFDEECLGSDEDEAARPVYALNAPVHALAMAWGREWASGAFENGGAFGDSVETARVTGVHVGPANGVPGEPTGNFVWDWSGEDARLPYDQVVWGRLEQ